MRRAGLDVAWCGRPHGGHKLALPTASQYNARAWNPKGLAQPARTTGEAAAVPRFHPFGGNLHAKWNPSNDKKPVTAAAMRPGQAGSKSSAASTAPAPLPAYSRATRPFQTRSRPPSPGNDCAPVMRALGNDLRARSKAPVRRDTGSGNSSNESSVHRATPGWTEARRLMGVSGLWVFREVVLAIVAIEANVPDRGCQPRARPDGLRTQGLVVVAKSDRAARRSDRRSPVGP